jgi:hypothetical protein
MCCSLLKQLLRDMAMNRIFPCFRIIQVTIGPLHYLSRCSDFNFEFAEIFLIENRLPISVSRGVGYRIFKRKHPISVSRRVVNSPHRWYDVDESPYRWLAESLYLIKFYNMKKTLDLYVCLLLQVSLVPAVVGLLCCWGAVVCIPAFVLLILLPTPFTPLPWWYSCRCFYCSLHPSCYWRLAVVGILLLVVSCLYKISIHDILLTNRKR